MKLSTEVLCFIIIALILIGLEILFYSPVMRVGEVLINKTFPIPQISLVISDNQSLPFFIPLDCTENCLEGIKENETLKEIAKAQGFDLSSLSLADLSSLKKGIKVQGYCYSFNRNNCYPLNKGINASIDFDYEKRPKYIVKAPDSELELRILLGIYLPKPKLRIREVRVDIMNGTGFGSYYSGTVLRSRNVTTLQKCKEFCRKGKNVENRSLCISGCKKANLAYTYNCSALEKEEALGCEAFYQLEWKPQNFIVIDVGEVNLSKEIKGPIFALAKINASFPTSGENCFSLNQWSACVYSCLEKSTENYEEEGCFAKGGNIAECIKGYKERCEEECDCSFYKRRSFEDPTQICYSFCHSRIGYFGAEDLIDKCLFGCNFACRNLDNLSRMYLYLGCSSSEISNLSEEFEGNHKSGSYSPECVGAYFLSTINSSVVPAEIEYLVRPYVKNVYSNPVYILNWKGSGNYTYPYANSLLKVRMQNQTFSISDSILEIINSTYYG